MTFAWQGFRIEHPEDWAPALISGNRQEGYARIASPDTLSLQIRWKHHPKDTKPLSSAVHAYLNQLERQARKAKVKFSSHVEGLSGGQWGYQWKGAGNGTGCMLWKHDRAYFVEVSSTNNRSTHSQQEKLVSSFEVDTGATELWSVFGLSVMLRTGLAVEKHIFQSGRTRIEWRDKAGRVIAERWGFGEQILAKHPFEEWAMDCMAMRKAKVTEVDQGLELEIRRPLLRIFGLARMEPAKNQLITLKVITRNDKGRPTWDWLT